MLNKANRLTKRGSFTFVYNKGSRSYNKCISLVYVKSKSLKIGFSVNNKIGKAVVRNKVKRRLRAIIRLLIGDIMPVQAVISVKPGAENLTFNETKATVFNLLKNAGLLKEIKET